MNILQNSGRGAPHFAGRGAQELCQLRICWPRVPPLARLGQWRTKSCMSSKIKVRGLQSLADGFEVRTSAAKEVIQLLQCMGGTHVVGREW
jgi:hypothetical protein